MSAPPRDPRLAAEGDLALGPVCPLPISEYPTVQMAHGGGGRLTQQLIERMFDVQCAKLGLSERFEWPETTFRRPTRQMALFE
mgnify:CR=1 FL=1